METENDLFFIMKNMRPMRRLKPDPIKPEVITEILDAAICAPNALNTQPYKFIVLEDSEEKAWFGKSYDEAMILRFTPILPDESDNSKNARLCNDRYITVRGLYCKYIIHDKYAYSWRY